MNMSTKRIFRDSLIDDRQEEVIVENIFISTIREVFSFVYG